MNENISTIIDNIYQSVSRRFGHLFAWVFRIFCQLATTTRAAYSARQEFRLPILPDHPNSNTATNHSVFTFVFHVIHCEDVEKIFQRKSLTNLFSLDFVLRQKALNASSIFLWSFFTSSVSVSANFFTVAMQTGKKNQHVWYIKSWNRVSFSLKFQEFLFFQYGNSSL